MRKTIIEKVFSKKCGTDAAAGMSVVCEVDKIMTNDASGPLSVSILKEHGYEKIMAPEKVAILMDHYTPCPNDQVAQLHQSLIDFQKENPKVTLTKNGYGIAHHLMDEMGLVAPGKLIVGGDSHSTTYGFLNAVGIGVGSTDIAIAMLTGKLWFKVPTTVKVEFVGKKKEGISGKDIALYLVNAIGPNGGSYRAFEFCGEGMADLDIGDRKTICNLLAECGAKCGIMPYDDIAAAYCKEHGIDASEAVEADTGCEYEEHVIINLEEIGYTISVPHNVHTIKPLEELRGLRMDMALLGTCTGGKIEDFREAYEVLKRTDEPFKSEVIVVPASTKIMEMMIEEGIASLLLEKGAMILPAGCGPCCGSSPGVPRDGFNVISTANRNFLGRMGNTKANIYLASPVVTAASALLGRVADPSEVK